jgi:hypothetical protein
MKIADYQGSSEKKSYESLEARRAYFEAHASWSIGAEGMYQPEWEKD